MRGLRGVLFVALLLFAGPAAAQERMVAEAYLEGLEAIWQADATSGDLDRLTSLLADSAVYEHPILGARIAGRSSIRAAMTAFLGTSRVPRITRRQTMEGAGVVILEFDLAMEMRGDDGWLPVERHQILVLEIRDRQVVRVVDHW